MQKSIQIDAFVSEFLNRGANIDARDQNGNTPLHLAALMGLAELTEKLLKWGADPNMVNGNGQLPLELALVKGLERDDNRTSQFSTVAQIILEEMEPVRYVVYQWLIMTIDIFIQLQSKRHIYYNTRQPSQD